MYKFIYLTI